MPPMGIEHDDFDVMIEAIETDFHKKNVSTCSQAQRTFEALDDSKKIWKTTSGDLKMVTGEFDISSVAGCDFDHKPRLSLYCAEFGKNTCGQYGSPRHVSILTGPTVSLGDDPSAKLEERLESWKSTHKYSPGASSSEKLLLLFEDSGSEQSRMAEAAAVKAGMFFLYVDSGIDEKALRMVVGLKVGEILQKSVLMGKKF